MHAKKESGAPLAVCVQEPTLRSGKCTETRRDLTAPAAPSVLLAMGPPPFQRFLDEHASSVHGFLVASVGHSEADDCFQETFIAALRAYPTLEHGGNLRGWVLTIAHRKAIDAHRARARRPLPSDVVPEQAVAAADVEAGVLDGEPVLWQAVDGLPPKQQAAVRHRFVEDLAYTDIGRLLGCSEAAARRNVHEGIKKLRETWA